MDKITEIRIEQIFDEESDQNYLWIYYYTNGEIEILSFASQMLKQIVRYLKWET